MTRDYFIPQAAAAFSHTHTNAHAHTPYYKKYTFMRDAAYALYADKNI
jgi:hypothetical protein